MLKWLKRASKCIRTDCNDVILLDSNLRLDTALLTVTVGHNWSVRVTMICFPSCNFHLDYCKLLLLNIATSLLVKWQRIQNTVARIILLTKVFLSHEISVVIIGLVADIRTHHFQIARYCVQILTM